VVDVNGIFHEIKDFTILGLDATRFKIVVVKAGYLVPEIAAIANPNLMALTGGAINQDIEHLESKHRVPSWPFQPDLQWKPSIVVSARSSAANVHLVEQPSCPSRPYDSSEIRSNPRSVRLK